MMIYLVDRQAAADVKLMKKFTKVKETPTGD